MSYTSTIKVIQLLSWTVTTRQPHDASRRPSLATPRPFPTKLNRRIVRTVCRRVTLRWQVGIRIVPNHPACDVPSVSPPVELQPSTDCVTMNAPGAIGTPNPVS